MSVWDTRQEYDEILPELQLISDILKGTRAMRGDAPTAIVSMYGDTRTGASPWLPRFETDSNESYALRWERAFCNGSFSHTVATIVGKAMSSSLRVSDVPSYLAAIENNADRMSTSLNRWAASHLARKVSFGGSGILVGMPTIESVPADMRAFDGNITEITREALDIRPYLVPVHRLSVRSWEWRERPGGGMELVYLAIREDNKTRRVGGKFNTYECLRTWELVDGSVVVRSYERNASEAKRSGDDGETPVTESTLDIGVIPFVWDATDDPDAGGDPMTGSPPLNELAWLQLAHFRETAEQGVAVLAARAECPVESGCDKEDKKKALTLTLGRAYRTDVHPNDHRLQYVGPSGKGVEHGEVSIRRLEDSMERLGSVPLARRAGVETAAGKKIDNASRQSIAAQWVEGTQDALEMAFEIADMFSRPTVKTPVGMRLPILAVEIPGLSTLDTEVAQVMVEELRIAVRDVGLPPRTYIEALVSSGYLPEGSDVDAILAEMDSIDGAKLTRTFAAQDQAMRLVRGSASDLHDSVTA